VKDFIVDRVAPVLLAFYFLAILLLFFAELGVWGLQNYFRATNQVLVLLGLLILPVVVIAISRVIHSLTVKISGQELHIELTELREDVRGEVHRVESNLGGQISNAERTLWPLLAGKDLRSDARLAENKLIIGSKLDTSHLFYGYLLSLVVEHYVTGADCEVRFPNGGSMKNFADAQNRWIDLYIDSSGTSCQYFWLDHQGKTDEQIRAELNRYGEGLGLKWMKALGASEDYCLVMKKEEAEKHGVQSIADLKILGPQLIFSADPEFLNRNDCYLGMQKYGIDFKRIMPCRVTERYELMKSGGADVFVGYETDPEIYRGDIIRLADPDQFFPRYLATPVVSIHALERVEGLEAALNKLHNAISTKDLIVAVEKIRRLDRNPAVAKAMAKEVINRLV